MITIIVADDHPLMRSGVKSVLQSDEQINIIAEAQDGQEALNLIIKHTPNVALIDVEMPKMNGLEIARRILELKLKTKIIFLTMYKDEDMFNAAMDTGAFGYVLKENAAEDILEGVKTVASGDYYISPLISSYLVKRLNAKKELELRQPSINDLTKSERVILKLIAEGKTSQQIADELHISYKTVENHRNNISKKLNLSGTHSLVKFAIKNKEKI
ncbi:response regulator transcription factor [Ignavibacterium sp.]|uniref:response regulator transcription factor n=1 Tax=Ignavibacterium sp. TaxID=2651167 RepID=UPI00307F4092